MAIKPEENEDIQQTNNAQSLVPQPEAQPDRWAADMIQPTERTTPEYVAPTMHIQELQSGRWIENSPAPQYIPEAQRPTYWSDPRRIGRYYHAIKSLPDESFIPEWIDKQGIESAYNYLKETRGGTWETWDNVTDDDPLNIIIKDMPVPPPNHMPLWEQEQLRRRLEYDKEYNPDKYQPDPGAREIGDVGVPENEWDSLPKWKQAMQRMVPVGQIGMQGFGGFVLGSFLSGGNPIVGAVGAGTMMGLSALTAKIMEKQARGEQLSVADKITLGGMMALNWPAEQLEKVIGTQAQILYSLVKPEKYGEIEEIFGSWENFVAAYQAGRVFYESLFSGQQVVDGRNVREEVKNFEGTLNDYLSTWIDSEGTVDPNRVIIGHDIYSNQDVTTQVPDQQLANAWVMNQARDRILKGESPNEVYLSLAGQMGFMGSMRELMGNVLLDPLDMVGPISTFSLGKVGKLTGNKAMETAFTPAIGKNKDWAMGDWDNVIQNTQLYKSLVRTMPQEQAAQLSSFGKWLGGLTADGTPKDLVYKANDKNVFNYLFGLTPKARSNYVLSTFVDGLNNLIAHETDVNTIEGMIYKVANMTPEDAVMGANTPVMKINVGGEDMDMNMPSYFSSAESQYIPGAIKDSLPAVHDLFDSYKVAEPQRAILNRVAEYMGIEPEQLLKKFHDAKPSEANHLYTQFLLKLQGQAKTDTGAAKILDTLTKGDEFSQLNGSKLKKMADQFMGSDGIPFNENILKYKLLDVMEQSIGKWAVDWFGVKPDKLIFRMGNLVKRAQGALLLGFNPSYFFNNTIDNMIKLSWDGLLGLDKMTNINAFLKDFGIMPTRLMQAAGAMDVGGIDTARLSMFGMEGRAIGEDIRAASRATGTVQAIDDLMRKGDKYQIAAKYSQNMERWSSQHAMVRGLQEYWNRVWQPGKGFSKVPDDLKLMLEAVEPGLSKKVEKLIARGRSKQQVEDAIFGRLQRRQSIKDVVDPDTLDMLDHLGITDEIDTRLKNATTPEDIYSAIDEAKNMLIDRANEQIIRNLEKMTNDAALKTGVEGLQGVIDLYDNIEQMNSDFWMVHMDTMHKIAEEATGKSGKFRSAVWFNGRNQQRIAWSTHENIIGSRMLGVFRGLGMDNASPEYLMVGKTIRDKRLNWADFFDYTQKEYDTFYTAADKLDPKDYAGRQALWYQASENINQRYIESIINEDALQKQLDDMFIVQYAKQFQNKGQQAILEARNWRSSVQNERRKMIQAQVLWRNGTLPDDVLKWGDLLPDDMKAAITKLNQGKPLHTLSRAVRDKISPKFWNDIYRQFVRDIAQSSTANAPGMVRAADISPDVQPDLPEMPKPEMPKQTKAEAKHNTDVWKVISEKKPELAGVDENGIIIPESKLNIIKYVLKWSPEARSKMRGNTDKKLHFTDIDVNDIEQAILIEADALKRQPELPTQPAPQAEPEVLPEGQVEGQQVSQPVMDEAERVAQYMAEQKATRDAEIDAQIDEVQRLIDEKDSAYELSKDPTEREQLRNEVSQLTQQRQELLNKKSDDLMAGVEQTIPQTRPYEFYPETHKLADIEDEFIQASVRLSLEQLLNDVGMNNIITPDNKRITEAKGLGWYRQWYYANERSGGKEAETYNASINRRTKSAINHLINGTESTSPEIISFQERILQEAFAHAAENDIYTAWKTGQFESAYKLYDQIADSADDARMLELLHGDEQIYDTLVDYWVQGIENDGRLDVSLLSDQWQVPGNELTATPRITPEQQALIDARREVLDTYQTLEDNLTEMQRNLPQPRMGKEATERVWYEILEARGEADQFENLRVVTEGVANAWVKQNPGKTVDDYYMTQYWGRGGTSLDMEGLAQLTPEVREANFKNWFGDSKVVDESGNPKLLYHGGSRIDRIDKVGKFDKTKATSGPMAYFTDDPDIASNYSTMKADNSLYYEAEPGEYFNNIFRVSIGDNEYSLIDAYKKLPATKRREIENKLKDVTPYDPETGDYFDVPKYIKGSGGVGGYDHWNYTFTREAGRDPIKTAMNIWLESGQLYNDETAFISVLREAGWNTGIIKIVEDQQGVIPVYASIKNPLNTLDIPENVITKLGERARIEEPNYVKPELGGADFWDKNIISPREWFDYFQEDYATKNTRVWTRIPDWVADELKLLGYDGIKDVGGKYSDKPHTVWIPFDEPQIKSVFNRGTFDPNDPRLLFQDSATDPRLIAYHNLDVNELIAADELGGFPLPSIAVTLDNIEYNDFGNVTLIGNSKMVDPERYGNRAFDADVWSPDFPTIRWREPETKLGLQLVERLKPYYEAVEDTSNWIDNYLFQEPSKPNLIETLIRRDGSRYAFLKEQGIDIDIPMRKREIQGYLVTDEFIDWYVNNKNKLYENEKVFQQEFSDQYKKSAHDFVKEHYAKLNDPKLDKIAEDNIEYNFYTDLGIMKYGSFDHLIRQIDKYLVKPERVDGTKLDSILDKALKGKEDQIKQWATDIADSIFDDPYIKIGNRKAPVTLSNVVDEMLSQGLKASQQTMTYGPNKARAQGANEFYTLDDMRAAKSKLADRETITALSESQKVLLDEYSNNLEGHYKWDDSWDKLNAQWKAIGDYLKKKDRSKKSMRNSLAKNDFRNLDDYIIQSAIKTAKSLEDTPRHYFEVKPQRATYFDEFSGAVLPKDSPQNVIDILKKHNLEYKLYDPNIPGDRLRAVQEFHGKENVLFQTERGLTRYLDDGLTVSHVFDGGDMTTIVHEVVHVYTPHMSMDHSNVFRDWLKKEYKMDLPEGWHRDPVAHRDASELLAKGFERYLADGKAPTAKLKQVFESFKRYMLEIYKAITGSDIDIKLTDDVRKVFDEWVAGDKAIEAENTGIKQPFEMTKKEYTSQDIREQRRTKVLSYVSDAVDNLGRDKLEQINFINKDETIEQWLEREWKQEAVWKYEKIGKSAGNSRKTQDTAIQKWSKPLDIFKDKAGEKALQKSVLEYIRGMRRGWFEKGETFDTISDRMFTIGDHYKIIKQALQEGKPVPPEVLADYPDLQQPSSNIFTPKPRQQGFFEAGEDTPLFSGTAQRAADETFAPQEIAPQDPLFDTREQLPTIQARQAEGGAEGTPLFGEQAIPDWVNTSDSFMQALKQPDGKYKLFYRGTRNEPFPGEVFNSASEARNYWKARQAQWNNQQTDSSLFQSAAQPGSPEFERWNKGNMLVDDDGKTITLYHGTDQVFDQFDRTGKRIPALGYGFYTTPNIEKAKMYGSNVMELYVRSRNLLDWNNLTKADKDKIIPVLQELVPEERLAGYGTVVEKRFPIDTTDIKVVEDFLKQKKKDTAHYWHDRAKAYDDIDDTTNEWIVRWMEPSLEGATSTNLLALAQEYNVNIARELGYDGAKYGDEVVVFNPEQIKSVNNYGQWSDNDPRMLYQSAATQPKETAAQGAPFGTADQLVNPPFDEMLFEGMIKNVLPALDDATMKLMDNNVPEKGSIYDRLPDDAKRRLKQYAGQVYSDMSSSKMGAIKYAEARRAFSLLDYSRRTGFDSIAGIFMPYQFWYTRSAINWLLRIMADPKILADYFRLTTFAQDAEDREGYPTRLKGKVGIPVPFLPDWMGKTVYIDPMRKIFNFADMARPFTQLAEQNNMLNKKTVSKIQQMIEDGSITEEEAQQAIETQSGEVWDNAMIEAKAETDLEIKNPLDFAFALASPSLPLSIAYNYASGNKDRISQLPITRTFQALTSMAGIGGPRGVNLEAPFRKGFGLPLVDQYEDYRINRELSNMVADGLVDYQTAIMAMMERKGQVFEEAQSRVATQMNTRTFLSSVGLDFFPEGEQEMRSIANEYYKALEAYYENDQEDALTLFWDEYPEYEARKASLQQDPNEMMRQFLRSRIWESWNEMSGYEKQQVVQGFGSTFEDSFLNKETRNYDDISTETYVAWAKTLGQRVPEQMAGIPEIPGATIQDEVATKLMTFTEQRDSQWPGISKTLSELYDLPIDKQQAYRDQHPEIEEYQQWRYRYIVNNPEVISYMTGESSELYGLPDHIQYAVYQYRVEVADNFPNIYDTQTAYFNIQNTNQKKNYLKQHPELTAYWDFRREYAAAYPQAAPYILSEESLAKSILGEDRSISTSTGTTSNVVQPVDTTQFDDALLRLLAGYFYGNRDLTPGARAELTRLWEKAGKPAGSVDNWLNAYVWPEIKK